MKLFYISNSTIPSNTANSVHVMKIANAFSANGHNVTLLAPNVGGDKLPADIYTRYAVDAEFKILLLPYFRVVPGRFRLDLYAVFSVIYSLLRKPDFVYGRSLLACSLYAFFNRACALELHSPISKFSSFERWVLRKAIKTNANFGVVSISEALKNILVSEGIPSERIHIAHDAADLPKNIASEAAVSRVFALKEKYEAVVGYVGHLYKGRGIEVVVDLASRFPYTCFFVVGGGADDVKYWSSKCSQENLVFFGHVSPAEAEFFRSSCDVLLAPYQSSVSIKGKGDTSAYMSPLKIFEYMSSGKPIICSDLPVLREVLNDDNSMLVGADDLDAWVSATEFLLRERDVAERLGLAAFSDFQRRYTWKQRAGEILSRFVAG